ncbi:MAG: Cache 3/Cache 2 fusion domain-containing protein [Calditrichia bacterium]|nr:Cache 3/Cache 2 fusion domain-containing protein [Calditrichia bacterium]
MISITEDSISLYIQKQHNEIGLRASNEIRLFLETPIKILETVVESQEIVGLNPFLQNLRLNKIVAKHPIFDRISVIDTLGNEITTTTFSSEEKQYSKDDFFTTVLKGEKYLSPVQFNEVKEPYIVSAHPILQFNEVIGIIAARINLRSIWELVDEIKIGETGNVFVISSGGQLIAHREKKKVLDRSEVIDLNLLKQAASKQKKSFVFFNSENEKMLGTSTFLEDFKWIVVIQQLEDEAFEIVSRMRYQVFAFVGLIIIIAIVLSYLLEKRITSPIKTLVDGVKRYADGDLDFRIPTQRYAEITVLADEFNTMAESLLLNQRKLRKAERLAAMSKFATLISHEIRNPLNSMNINMQILKREIEKSDGDIINKNKYSEIIISEIQRMDNLINNFLTISRPPRFDLVQHNIHAILDEVIFSHSAMAEQQKIKINKRYCESKLLANVDGDQMKQVFHNIIINAFQAMPKGGNLDIITFCIEITKSNTIKIPAFRIEFKDSGYGIASNKVDEIFDFYYTSKKTGTGLGLAIARQIIDGHKGLISVESNEGKGIKLIIEIPVHSENIGIKN